MSLRKHAGSFLGSALRLRRPAHLWETKLQIESEHFYFPVSADLLLLWGGGRGGWGRAFWEEAHATSNTKLTPKEYGSHGANHFSHVENTPETLPRLRRKDN